MGLRMLNSTPIYLQRGPLLALPAKWSEIRLIAALSRYQTARHLAKQLGLNPDNLSSEFSRQLTRALLNDTAIPEWIAEGLHCHDANTACSWKGVIAVCHRFDDGTRTEEGALAAGREFMAAIRDKELAEACSWAAGAIERGEFTPNDRRDLKAAHDAAGVLR